jgi:hypothetical protein
MSWVLGRTVQIFDSNWLVGIAETFDLVLLRFLGRPYHSLRQHGIGHLELHATFIVKLHGRGQIDVC